MVIENLRRNNLVPVLSPKADEEQCEANDARRAYFKALDTGAARHTLNVLWTQCLDELGDAMNCTLARFLDNKGDDGSVISLWYLIRDFALGMDTYPVTQIWRAAAEYACVKTQWTSLRPHQK